MKRATIMTAGVALALGAQTALAQQKVPVMALSPASAKSQDNFGFIFGIQQLPGGEVLVNDGGRRRLVKLDPTLSKTTVVIDSASGSANSYGPRAANLISYLGDSTLFVDIASSSLLVIDPKGQVARVTAAPKPQDIFSLAGGQAYVDDKGRLLYRTNTRVVRNAPQVPGEKQAPIAPPDSATIVRADFDTRMVDTVGRVKVQQGMRINPVQTPDGKMQMTVTINPLQTVDDWAVLSDGSLAFVRGQDYHVDVLHPNGTKTTGSKLPFDWKRLTDDDKQKLIDSARTAQEEQSKANAAANANNPPGTFTMGGGGDAARAGMEVRTVVMAAGGGGGGGGGGGSPMIMGGADGGRGGPISMSAPKVEFVPISEIADYYPAIRSGAAKADLDGNLWVLTTTTAQASTAGELVYDVINKNGELFQRVRLPQGRSIAGFGRKGVVYLMTGDRTAGFYLERSSILGGGRATQE